MPAFAISDVNLDLPVKKLQIDLVGGPLTQFAGVIVNMMKEFVINLLEKKIKKGIIKDAPKFLNKIVAK